MFLQETNLLEADASYIYVFMSKFKQQFHIEGIFSWLGGDNFIILKMMGARALRF